MKRFSWLLGVSFVAMATVIAAPASRAGADISFGLNAPIGNDGNLFFSISSRYFDRDAHSVNDWSRRLPDPDDLAVFLHICSQSHLPPDVVFGYRRQGLSWYDVGVRVHLPLEVWYVPVARDPGPPYGKAYGYRKKHERDPRYAVRLSDRQVRDLVAVRMAHEYYGVPPETAMDWRRGGADVRTIMAREYRTRHAASGPSHDHDNGHDHGHDSHGKHDDKHHED
jgi:hypothetical protein